jgi:hypothetical protein
VEYVVRFDRSPDSTGPDAIVVHAARYVESYHEGVLQAYRFLDVDGGEVAMVRSPRVAYIAIAGTVSEPASEEETERFPPATTEDVSSPT